MNFKKSKKHDWARRFLAKTFGYSYNANKPGTGNLIRYDSPDVKTFASTSALHFNHHKHIYNGSKETIIILEEDEWPHIDEFLLEVMTHY